ncbi:sensor histidine kinase, partial [Bacillus sp. JJ1521]
MREFNNKFNKKTYYIVVWLSIAIMVAGLLIGNPFFREFRYGYIFHLGLVFILSVCLLLYPWKSTGILRICIIGVASSYFYTIFLLYPETKSSFIF